MMLSSLLLLLLAACGAGDSSTDDAVADTDDTTTTDTDTDTEPDGIAVDNASFEQPTITSPGAWSTVAPTGWQIQSGGAGGVYRGDADGLTASDPLASPADGKQAAYLTGVFGGGYDLIHTRPIVQQETMSSFTVTAAVAKRKDATLTGSGDAYVKFEGPFDPMSCTQTTVSFDTLRANEGAWQQVSATCPTLREFTVKLGAVGFQSDDDQLLFDNVRVTAN